MQIFDESEAMHFCGGYTGTANASQHSLKNYRTSVLNRRVRNLIEGTPQFNDYRDCSLRDAERALFMAASNYVRFHNLVIGTSSSWGYVTLYYASFYAASALLHMFGAWIDFPHIIVQGVIGTPNSQELHILYPQKGTADERTAQSMLSCTKGTHRTFWDLFYQAFRGLHGWITDAEMLLENKVPLPKVPGSCST